MGLRKKAEHAFKDFFFRVTSPLLHKGQKDFQPLDGGRLQRVLFLRPEKIGDLVISFPVFDALKRRYPHIEISIMGAPRSRAIIDGDPRFANIYMYTKNPKLDLPEFRRIRAENFDCIVDMICGGQDDSVTALYLSQYLAPGKPRIGVGKKRFRKYYDFICDYRQNNTGHIVDNTLQLLKAFGIDPSTVDGYAVPHVPEEAKEMAREFIGGIQGDGELVLKIGYNLSAGASSRVWKLEKSIDLIERILRSRPEVHVVLFTTPDERERAEQVRGRVAEDLRERVTLIPDGLSLKEVSAVIALLDLMISPDTSLVHIARAFRVPVVGLYSRHQKNFLLWKPYDQEEGAVVSDNEDNIFDITVDRVMETFELVMARRVKVKN